MPEPKTHAERRNWLESLARQIPGFGGYLERDLRRESDTLQRTWLADRLQAAKRPLDRVARALVDAARLDSLGRVDRLRLDLDRLVGRIRGAMPGYSGFFDLVRIDEAVLDQVYEHDVELMTDVDVLAKAIESLPAAPDQLDTELAKVEEQLATLHRAWDRREDYLKGIN